jgi:hypothetical protein
MAKLNLDLEKQLVRDFISDYLDNDIAKFKDFDLSRLKESPKYGGEEEKFECENSNLIKAVYLLLWGNSVPDLTSDTLGKGKAYRGNAINSFRIMFGNPAIDNQMYFTGLENYNPSNELRSRVAHFYKYHRTLGNYIILPNKSCNKKTITYFRCMNKWHDYFDRYLVAIQEILEEDKCEDEEFLEIVNKNNFFFDWYKGPEGFKELIETFYLSDFLNKSNKVSRIFIMNFYWRNPQEIEMYTNAANVYLSKAEKIIAKRSLAMIDRLEMILEI